MKYFSTLAFVIFFTQAFTQTQLGTDIDGELTTDEFGAAVSLSFDGKRVAVGGRENDGTGPAAGHVRIVEFINGSWTQIGSDIDGEAPGDQSGTSVALSGNGKRVVIGANRNDGVGVNSGHVRVFRDSSDVWVQLGNDIEAVAAGDQFGWATSIAADGQRIAIGAPYQDGNGLNDGVVRIFHEIGGVWTQVGNDITGESAGDNAGYSVDLSSNGTRVAIGAIYNDQAGHVRVFEDNGGVWTQIGSDLDGEAPMDNYGNAVSLSADGKRLAIGGRMNDGSGQDAGQVTILEEIAGTWSQIGNDIDGYPGEQFGFSVNLSGDGNKFIAGAPLSDISGTENGVARVFEYLNGSWSQIGNDIVGESIGDRCGEAVAFSPDGNLFAVGANYNDGTAFNAGHVRVYGVCCPVPAFKVELSALLEGPYDPTVMLMNDDLRLNSSIPLSEPYTALGYSHIGGGGETISQNVLNITGPNAIVDWVFVELRAASDSTMAVATRSALIQADGDVVDLDGLSGVDFTSVGIGSGSYWAVLRHRTHIDVMSTSPIYIDGLCPGVYDFNALGAFNNGIKFLLNGSKALFEGDVNQDGVINSSDRSRMWNNRNLAGYVEEDTDLNGVSNANDRSRNWNNRNVEAQTE